MDSSTDQSIIYVRLLGEGTEVSRPTRAIDLGDGLYKLLPTPDYSPDAEVWEFPPGSTVGVKEISGEEDTYLLAVKPGSPLSHRPD